MPSVKLSPIFNDQIVDGNGVPAIGWKISTYVAGSTTPAPTFTTVIGDVSHSNPIVLDSLGYTMDGPIWLQAGVNYKFVLTDANDVVKKTIDNVTGVNDSAATISQWQSSGVTPTFISTTQFSVPGDKTSDFHIGRRAQFQVGSGTVYGTIIASAYSPDLTTVTVRMDGTSVLDNGLSVVNLSLLREDQLALPAHTAGTAIAPISASVASNALTVNAGFGSIDFRPTNLQSSTPNTRVGNPANLVIPQGATLGTVSAQTANLAILAIDNAGTVETAIVNLAGGVDLSETGVINTVAISAGATAANVIYSQTARTGVPYKVRGYITITEATAGTWATAPALVQGTGGQPLATLASSAYANWQTVTRTPGVTYYNNLPRDKKFKGEFQISTSAIQVDITINGVSQNLLAGAPPSSGTLTYSGFTEIPPGASYVMSVSGTYTAMAARER